MKFTQFGLLLETFLEVKLLRSSFLKNISRRYVIADWKTAQNLQKNYRRFVKNLQKLFSVKIILFKVSHFEKFGIKGRNCHVHKNVAHNL